MKRITYSALLLPALGAVFFLYNVGLAQAAPNLMITWKADSFVPSDYQGKILPTRNTNISASVELIDGNKIADLSGQEVRWFLNKKLLAGGKNKKTITFNTNLYFVSGYQIEASVVGYKGQDVSKTVFVPLTAPTVIINSPYPGKTIKIGESRISALLYFFPIEELSEAMVSWVVGNNPAIVAPADKSEIVLQTPGGANESVSVSVTATTNDKSESATESMSLNISK